jgi:hypothetical protein
MIVQTSEDDIDLGPKVTPGSLVWDAMYERLTLVVAVTQREAVDYAKGRLKVVKGVALVMRLADEGAPWRCGHGWFEFYCKPGCKYILP